MIRISIEEIDLTLTRFNQHRHRRNYKGPRGFSRFFGVLVSTGRMAGKEFFIMKSTILFYWFIRFHDRCTPRYFIYISYHSILQIELYFCVCPLTKLIIIVSPDDEKMRLKAPYRVRHNIVTNFFLYNQFLPLISHDCFCHPL